MKPSEVERMEEQAAEWGCEMKDELEFYIHYNEYKKIKTVSNILICLALLLLFMVLW